MKQRIIILCGPDRCGKTNIAAALQKELDIKVFKASTEHDAFLNDQDRFLMDLRYADPRICDFLRQTGVSVIFDRGFPCERVYSDFFKRKTDDQMLKKLDEQYAKMDTYIIICTRKSFDGITDDLSDKLDCGALTKISELYMNFASWTKCKCYTLYVDDEDLSREVSEIRNFLGV